jgi:hypothetical protein
MLLLAVATCDLGEASRHRNVESLQRLAIMGCSLASADTNTPPDLFESLGTVPTPEVTPVTPCLTRAGA